MVVGTEWIVDADGCRAEDLRSVEKLDAVFKRIVRELGLHSAGPTQWRQFPGPGGVTGLQLLTESHLTCHTYPEYATATFNLYCCRERPTWPWTERLAEMLGARDVRVRTCMRGSTEATANTSAQPEIARNAAPARLRSGRARS